jgi:hypothetical protein
LNFQLKSFIYPVSANENLNKNVRSTLAHISSSGENNIFKRGRKIIFTKCCDKSSSIIVITEGVLTVVVVLE